MDKNANSIETKEEWLNKILTLLSDKRYGNHYKCDIYIPELEYCSYECTKAYLIKNGFGKCIFRKSENMLLTAI